MMKNSVGDLGVQTHGLLVLYLPISGEAVLEDFKQLYSFCTTAVDCFVALKENQSAGVKSFGPGSTSTVRP